MACYNSRGRWIKRSSNEGSPVKAPQSVDAVEMVERLVDGRFRRPRSRGLPGSMQWKTSLQMRKESHIGYKCVHVQSMKSSLHGVSSHLDDLPWERRDVKQRFLYDNSVSFCKNWFGVLLPSRGNRIYDEPICQPQSMLMPVDEYDDEIGAVDQEKYYQDARSSPRSCIYSTHDDFRNFGEDNPECGTLRNIRARVGEPLSRVTPDHTSSLRLSRWRKRHFPHGTFPYQD